MRAVRFGLRAAFSVARSPVMPLTPGDGPAEDLAHRPGDQRPEHEEGDEQDQHPWAERPSGAGEEADEDQPDAHDQEAEAG